MGVKNEVECYEGVDLEDENAENDDGKSQGKTKTQEIRKLEKPLVHPRRQ